MRIDSKSTRIKVGKTKERLDRVELIRRGRILDSYILQISPIVLARKREFKSALKIFGLSNQKHGVVVNEVASNIANDSNFTVFLRSKMAACIKSL